MLLGGRRMRQPSVDRSIEGDGRPGQEQQGSGRQRLEIGTDSGVGDTTTNHQWRSAVAAEGAAGPDDTATGEDDVVVFCIIVIVDNDDNRVPGIPPLELQ
jgi:hypothetical protein